MNRLMTWWLGLLLATGISSARALSTNWPPTGYTEVRAYLYNLDGQASSGILTTNGRPDRASIFGPGVVLAPPEVERLLQAARPEPSKWITMCYSPRHAFVFYDADAKPVGFLEVCLECGNYRMSGQNDSIRNFDFEELHALLVHLEFPVLRSGDDYKVLAAKKIPPGPPAVHVTGANITEVGLYEARGVTNGVSATGVKRQALDEFRLRQSTTNAPARLGTRFGFRYEITGTPANTPVTLTMVGKHPPIKDSETGKTTTNEMYRLHSWMGKSYTSYSLDTADDLVPGPWTFEIWHDTKKLCEQSFQVVAEEKIPAEPGK